MGKESPANNEVVELTSLIQNAEYSAIPILFLEKSKIVNGNGAFLRQFGYTDSKDVANRSVKNILTPAHFKKLLRFMNDDEEIPQKGFEAVWIKHDNSRFEGLVFLSALNGLGVGLFQATIVDITDREEQIRSLSASDQHHKELVKHTSHGMARVAEGKINYVNPAFLALFGYEIDEDVIDNDYTILFPESETNRVLEALQKFEKKKFSSQTVHFLAVRKDRTEFAASIDWVKSGNTSHGDFIAYHTDETELIRTSRELDRKGDETVKLHEIVSAMDYSKDLQHILQSGLLKIMDLIKAECGGVFLYDKAAKTYDLLIRRNLPDEIVEKLDHQSNDEGIGGFISKTVEAHIINVNKYPSFLPYSKLFKEAGFISLAFAPLVIKETCTGYILICSKKSLHSSYPSTDFFGIIGREIGSAIKNAGSFREMEKSEESYRGMIESVKEILYTSSPNGAFTYISPVIEELTGYPPPEFFRNPTLWLSLVHPDDKKFLLERNATIDSVGDKTAYEYRVLPKGKASYRWVRDFNAIVKNEHGEIIGINGLISDITADKERAIELLQSSEINSSVLSNIHEGVVVFNTAMKCVRWNKSMEKITGLKKDSVAGKSAKDLFIPGADNDFSGIIDRALKNEVVHSEDIHYVVAENKRDIYISGRFSPLTGENDETIGVVGIINDAGERKGLERELKESEQVLRNIIDTIGDILMITDLKGNVAQVNRAFLNLLGFTRQEVIGHEFPYPWLIEEEMGRYVLWIGSLREKNWLHDFDMTWRTKEGRLISMSLSTTLLRNSMGDPIAMVNIARDISDRKRLTKDLENRNKQVELLNRIISAANQSMDFEEIINIIANEIKSVVPFDELYILTVQPDPRLLKVYAAVGEAAKYQHVEFDGEQTLAFEAIQLRKPMIADDLSQTKYRDFYPATEGYKSKIAIPIILKDKVLGCFGLYSFAPAQFSQQHLIILESLVSQVGAIMDRIALFKQVSEDALYIHNLLDSIDSVVYTIDTQYRILEVNKAWHEFIRESGIEPLKDYHGISIFDALPDESLKVLFQSVAGDVLSGVVRFFSQEFSEPTPGGVRIYQLTMNPMIIDRKITGLVISHSDITALKESELALKESNEQLITLNEIAALHSTARDLQDILSTTIPLLRRMIGADAAVVYLVSRRGTVLEMAHQVGFKDAAVLQLPGLIKTGAVTGIVVGTKEPVYVSNIRTEEQGFLDINKEFFKDEQIESAAIIPLTSKDEVIGALDIFYRSSHRFTEQERQLLTLIGNQLGTAIENAQLYGELRSQINRLTVLYEFSEQLTSKLDIDQIYGVVYEHVARVIPFNAFSIYLFSHLPGGIIANFQVKWTNGEYVVQFPQVDTHEVAKAIPGWKVFETKRSYHNEDYSIIHVPMFSKESIIGVMTIAGRESVNYSDVHLRLLESIANLTAIALEKGKLYEETVQKSSEIERRNKELDDFTYVVSHDLKEPLISIEGFSKILQIDYRDLLKGEGKEYLDSITGASVRMKALIDDLLMLSRVSRPSESFKPVSVDAVIQDIKNDMEFTIRQRNVRFILPEKLPHVLGHETQVKIVFRNLIGNALKFNNSPEPMVEIGFQNGENNYYLFSVRDNGIGIEKEFFEKIFVIFQRLHRREDYEGTGAGLAIVKKIIEIHKGTIWVESEPGSGSTFYFTLPKYTMNQ